MSPVGDDFFLALAEISAGLTGLFLVGMILYIQIGYERTESTREVVEPYFRAATSITIIAFAIPLVVSLAIVALPIGWAILLYFALTAALVVVNVSTVSTVRRLRREVHLPLLVMIEVVGSVVIVVMLVLPFVLGGFSLTREDLTPGLLLSLGIAFLGTWALVLTLFDLARIERTRSEEAKGADESPEGD